MTAQVAASLQGRLFQPPESTDSGVFPVSPIAAVNVACVPQYSPLRYPGGKTWLIPHIRYWLSRTEPRPRTIIEPFSGGGVISLAAVLESLVERCLMVELDRQVAAFWHTALRHGAELSQMISKFEPTRAAVLQLSDTESENLVEQGFRTLVLNRTRRGGILAHGASLSRVGENGRGVASRWYPQTLTARLQNIAEHSDQIGFVEGDGMALLETLLPSLSKDTVLFVDPPYTAGGKRAGKRLYAHNIIDHARLFSLLAESRSRFLMTYDYAAEIVELIDQHGFHAVQVLMKNTHHARVPELVITPEPVFTS